MTKKAVQNTKRERWDGEEVHCSNGLAMVSEERQPSFHGIWISPSSPDASRDTPLRNIETQLEQFTVNARCIEVKEFIDTGNPNQRVTGLGLLVKNQAEALSHTSLIDYDEIDSLVQAIDYISKLSQSAVPGKDIEVAFKTKGGFAVWASNRGKSEVIAAVSSQGQEREVVARINSTLGACNARLLADGNPVTEAQRAWRAGSPLRGTVVLISAKPVSSS